MEEQGLRPVTDILQDVLSQSGLGKRLSDKLSDCQNLTVEQVMQRRADRYNASVGKLDATSNGYSCQKCKNRGYTAILRKSGGGVFEQFVECDCMPIRRSIWRIMDSGLAESMRTQKLKTFKATEPWQQTMLDKAQEYVQVGAEQGAWFYAGGQSGCGKTHLCTGIARELLYKGMELYYVVWEQTSKELKAIVNDPDFGTRIGKLEQAKVLYIDDLFKPIRDECGGIKPPSAADVRLAFELLNYRYVNKLPTIISSEKYLSEIMDIDEATGGRIYERSRGYALAIERNTAKNYRRRDDVTV